MNTKNIILAILMVLSFAACSSEIEGIDNNMTDASVNSNSETSLSVRMVSNGINTKAYTFEFEIENYVIAVFDSQSGERIGFTKKESFSTDEIVTIDNIRTKEGKAHVVVITDINRHSSNGEWTMFDNLYTYDEYVGQTLTNTGFLKVGISKNVTLSATASAVTVELEQLKARVEVNLSAKTEGAGPNTVATMVATRYEAKVSRATKIIPEVNALNSLSIGTYDDGTASFWYVTTKTEAKDITVWVMITVDKGDGSEPTVVRKTISVPFLSNGQPVTVLENGVSYNIEVEAKISVKYEVELSYQLHAINTITQDEITFN